MGIVKQHLGDGDVDVHQDTGEAGGPSSLSIEDMIQLGVQMAVSEVLRTLGIPGSGSGSQDLGQALPDEQDQGWMFL